MSSELYPLPWQQSLWQNMVAVSQHLHHAFILVGPEGIGKQHFAQAYGHYLLCEHSHQQACGQCKACHLLAAGTHPDFYLIQPEEKSKVIKIDQIRGLIEELNKTAQQGHRRVIILEPAETMNEAAANALLKKLEEPGQGIHFFLMTHSLTQLPKTIISRCQCIHLPVPNFSQSLHWLQAQKIANISLEMWAHLLKLTGGAPVAVCRLIEQYSAPTLLEISLQWFVDLSSIAEKRVSPVMCAEKWQAQAIPFITLWTWWIYDVHQCLMRGPQVELITFMQKLLEVKSYLKQSVGLNEALLLEDLLISWAELKK